MLSKNTLSEKEKMLSGLAHQPFSAELKQLRLQNKERLFELNTQTRPSDINKKNRLLLEIFGKVGNQPNIVTPFYCDYGCFIEVGKNFFANYNCTILDNGGVKIGDNVLFAPNVSLYTVGHPLDPELRNQEWEQAHPITIGNNVCLGGNVVILPGVKIGDNVVVGAGSVVNKNIPPNSIVVGNPAKVLRQITQQDREDYLKTYLPNV